MADGFCGWYFRCQSHSQTLALIPAAHSVQGRRSGSLQIISDDGCWNADFDGAETLVEARLPRAVLGRSLFQETGIRLCLDRPQLRAEGQLSFGPLSPLRRPVMGPFRWLPHLECQHSVISMRHGVNGVIYINDREYRFREGEGYLEGDRGRSFPRHYAWTQCWFPGGSLMLSLAEIPLSLFSFTGIIGIVQLHGREYRLATYRGARPVRIARGEIAVRQGELSLSAALLEEGAFTLRAPEGGAMSRLVRENVACRVGYRFCVKGRPLLSFVAERAAFEFEYPDRGKV